MTPDKKERLKMEAEVRDALSTTQGRRLMWRMLEWGGILSTTAVIGSPEQTYFNEGRRSLAIQILTHLETYAPGSMDLMRKEARDELDETSPHANAPVGTGRRSTSPRTVAGSGPDDPAVFDPYNPTDDD